MENGVMLQAFEWNTPADHKHYQCLTKAADHLASLGFTGIWMPPAGKGTSGTDVGYGNYDFWDLGEFDQKGSIPTKYGTRAELEECIRAFHKNNVKVYADMVFNHKGGADETELFEAVMVNADDRTEDISEAHNIEGWTKFTFPGRHGKYSQFEWNFNHFTGVDYDDLTKTKAIFRILGDGKYWAANTDDEYGNFDYLMNADIDHSHPDVLDELMRVTHFMIDEIGVDGFRFDALKHMSSDFIDHLSADIMAEKPDFYFVGEYWKDDEGTISHYLDNTNYKVDLFDVPLHFNLSQASLDPEYDLRTIFDGSLVQEYPMSAVTFVDNHDTQPGEALESWIDDWFKDLAYSLILLRRDGYPCVFWGDYAGIPTMKYPGIRESLEKMMYLRTHLAYGEQDEYFTNEHMIGWVRRGDEDHPFPLAVLLSSGDASEERMFVGESEAGQTYINWNNPEDTVDIDDEGFGLFPVPGGSAAWWTQTQVFEKYNEEHS
ncbi:alpha-amylase [Alloscardovia criceti]|uniref:alpha-amylase n=1 Tax=Alloscardovia criceti TaxID=356828 RepID=UPI00036C4504|nr:alpha-amylase [Alloscardovia criceti]